MFPIGQQYTSFSLCIVQSVKIAQEAHSICTSMLRPYDLASDSKTSVVFMSAWQNIKNDIRAV